MTELTEEQKKLSYHNWYKARKELNLIGTKLVLHHKDQTLKYSNIERYIEWRIDDLEVLTQSEHNRIHSIGRTLSEASRQKCSEHHMGIRPSDESKLKNRLAHIGKPRSGPTNIGKKWFNDGEHNILAFTCPEGCMPGMIKNNRRAS